MGVNMVEMPKELKTLQGLSSHLVKDTINARVGAFGGRRFVILLSEKGEKKAYEFKLNDMVTHLTQLLRAEKALNPSQKEQINTILKKIDEIDQSGQKVVNDKVRTNNMQRWLTKLKSLLGKLLFNRAVALEKIKAQAGSVKEAEKAEKKGEGSKPSVDTEGKGKTSEKSEGKKEFKVDTGASARRLEEKLAKQEKLMQAQESGKPKTETKVKTLEEEKQEQVAAQAQKLQKLKEAKIKITQNKRQLAEMKKEPGADLKEIKARVKASEEEYRELAEENPELAIVLEEDTTSGAIGSVLGQYD